MIKFIGNALSYNPNAGSLLKKNIEKINWYLLSFNPYMFELNYDYVKERCSIYKEELLQISLHPSKIKKLLDTGIKIGDFDNYI